MDLPASMGDAMDNNQQRTSVITVVKVRNQNVTEISWYTQGRDFGT